MNKFTLITGATSGIGYALAQEFAKKKHNLLLTSRNITKMSEIKNDFEKKYQIEVVCFQADLSKENSPEELYRFCKDNNYEIEILVNNAGIGLGGGIQVDHSLENVMKLLNLNLITLTKLSTLFGREMKERKAGYIMNIASTAAFQPMPYSALYAASKAFVLSLSEAMTLELKEFNVGVTTVCPGITDTDFFKYGGREPQRPNVPGWLYRMISPELVARRAIKAMYKKKLYTVPYFQHWLIAQVSRFLPRYTAAGIMKKVEKRRKRL